MQKVEITAAARQAIMSRSTRHFVETGERLPNGNWIIPLQQSTLDSLHANAHKEETLSDTIIRICSHKQ